MGLSPLTLLWAEPHPPAPTIALPAVICGFQLILRIVGLLVSENLSINIDFTFHQMGSMANKMHQIRFRPGLRPRPRWGAYDAPQTP